MYSISSMNILFISTDIGQVNIYKKVKITFGVQVKRERMLEKRGINQCPESLNLQLVQCLALKE